MSHDVRILATPLVAVGFGLTGLPVTAALDPTDAEEICRSWLDDPAAGIVLLEETMHDSLPDEIRKRLARRPLPLVVPFPGPEPEAAPESADAYIVELLRQVIGYRVKIR
jgi:vacuolar-type H+-ATPase subunit F/Vma7